MKKLNVSQMENLQGGVSACAQAVNVGCALAGVTMGIVSFGAGFAFGLGCSMIATHYDACKGR